MAEGIEDRAAQLGVKVTIAEAHEDPLKQLDQVRGFVAQHADGILISPVDAVAAIPAYRAARKAGIPIFSIARRTRPDVEDGFVGADEATLARRIARWTCRALHGKGEIAMLNGPPGASFVRIMMSSYKAELGAHCRGAKIVFETNIVPMTPAGALTAAKDALTAHPDLDAFYGNVDDLASGAVRALEEQHALGRIVVTGFDGTRVDLVRAGKLDMTIALRPYNWGKVGLDTIVRRLRGIPVPRVVQVRAVTVDRSNVATLHAATLR
jgi:ribose transport system substrate-binding protein